MTQMPIGEIVPEGSVRRQQTILQQRYIAVRQRPFVRRQMNVY
jgi:hypothetical protein